MTWMIIATRHENRHFVVKTYSTSIFIVKFLIIEKIFKEILGRGLRDNGKNINIYIFLKMKGNAGKGHFFAKLYLLSMKKLNTS